MGAVRLARDPETVVADGADVVHRRHGLRRRGGGHLFHFPATSLSSPRQELPALFFRVKVSSRRPTCRLGVWGWGVLVLGAGAAVLRPAARRGGVLSDVGYEANCYESLSPRDISVISSNQYIVRNI